MRSETEANGKHNTIIGLIRSLYEVGISPHLYCKEIILTASSRAGIEVRREKEGGDQMKVIAEVQMKKNVPSFMVVAMVMEKRWWLLEVKSRKLADGLDMGCEGKKGSQE